MNKQKSRRKEKATFITMRTCWMCWIAHVVLHDAITSIIYSSSVNVLVCKVSMAEVKTAIFKPETSLRPDSDIGVLKQNQKRFQMKVRLIQDQGQKTSNLLLQPLGFIAPPLCQWFGCFSEEGITSCQIFCKQKEKTTQTTSQLRLRPYLAIPMLKRETSPLANGHVRTQDESRSMQKTSWDW